MFHSSGSHRDDRGTGTFGLHPIPSVIDLPNGVGVGIEVGGIGSGVEGVSKDLKMRGFGSGGSEAGRMLNGEVDEKIWNGYDKESAGKDGGNVKHYDADGKRLPLVFYPSVR